MQTDLTLSLAELVALEESFAYEHASGLIETHGLTVIEPGMTDDGAPWIDIAHADAAAVNALPQAGYPHVAIEPFDLSEECAYLRHRGLLEIHPEHPEWVRIRDEDEALPTPIGEM